MGKVPARFGDFFCGVTPEERYSSFLIDFFDKESYKRLLEGMGLPKYLVNGGVYYFPDGSKVETRPWTEVWEESKILYTYIPGQDLSQFPADAGG